MPDQGCCCTDVSRGSRQSRSKRKVDSGYHTVIRGIGRVPELLDDQDAPRILRDMEYNTINKQRLH